MFNVYINGKKEKTYKHKLQAAIWCWMKGYVWGNYRIGNFLDPRVKILEE